VEYFNFDFSTDYTYYIKAFISSGDYEKILADQSFTKIISAIEMENKQVLSRAVRVKKSITSLLNFLKKEIMEK